MAKFCRATCYSAGFKISVLSGRDEVNEGNETLMWLWGNSETLVGLQGNRGVPQRTLIGENRSFPAPRHDLGSGFQYIFLCFRYIYGILQMICNVLSCFPVTIKAIPDFSR